MIRIHDSQAALMQAAAEYFAACYQVAVEAHGRFSVALAGGSTPRALYVLLARDGAALGIDWAKVHFFWGDERCVPPDHTDSNYRMAFEALLQPVNVPEANIHRMRGELAPAEAAAAYDHALRVFGGADFHFDLVLLGMGDDGHTASLFPHTAALNVTEGLAVENYVPRMDTWRITLTAPAINRAAHVAFLVTGNAKADVLKAVLEGPANPAELPSQMIRPTQGELVWFLDDAAATALSQHL